jgi:hypothetical protein
MCGIIEPPHDLTWGIDSIGLRSLCDTGDMKATLLGPESKDLAPSRCGDVS